MDSSTCTNAVWFLTKLALKVVASKDIKGLVFMHTAPNAVNATQ